LLESVSTAIPFGGWNSSTQVEIYPLAKTDWRLKQQNNNGLQRISFIWHREKSNGNALQEL
jgi:hypothetical protein